MLNTGQSKKSERRRFFSLSQNSSQPTHTSYNDSRRVQLEAEKKRARENVQESLFHEMTEINLPIEVGAKRKKEKCGGGDRIICLICSNVLCIVTV